MIWFFERQNSRLHYEIRRQADGPGCELVITSPDGSQAIEQYADARALLERAQALERALTADGWHAPVPRRGPIPTLPHAAAW